MPVRADALMCGGLRLEFYWTQMHRLHCGISWRNAEILFPLGAFALIFVAVCSIITLAIEYSKFSGYLLTLCFIAHILFRGLIDYYLLTTYWPLTKSKFYWEHVGVGWRILAFTGAIASVIAMALQLYALITNKSRITK